MASRKGPLGTSVQDIIDMLTVKDAAAGKLLIVDSTILRRLIGQFPNDKLGQFVTGSTPQGPESETSFGAWVKLARKQLGLSQRKFADLLKAKGLKIHGSDIGNIEKGLRSEDYSPDRIDQFRATILEALKEIK